MRNLLWVKQIVNLRWVLESAIKTFKRLFRDYIKNKLVDERAKELVYKVIVWNILALIIAYLTEALPT